MHAISLRLHRVPLISGQAARWESATPLVFVHFPKTGGTSFLSTSF
jgi:hypothetical protein